MPLTLIRIDPDPVLSARWFAAENLLPRTQDDGGYAWHAILSAAFGRKRAPKPFRILARRGRDPQVLAYAETEAAVLQRAAEDFADPVAFAALRLGEKPVVGKLMPRFAPGQRLGFSVRARPTVRIDRDGDRRKSAEIDAYVAALRAAPGEPADRKPVYARWTRDKLEAGGAKVHELRFDGLEQVKVVRRDAAGRPRPVEGHSAAFVGVLDVTDPDAFGALLARGIGRHRSFGYGMLLLSPA
jgi:CRISPR system Cascade subunit CasE